MKEQPAQFNLSFNNFKPQEPLPEPLNSSARRRTYYRPHAERSRSRGSFDRYEKYRYNVSGAVNLSNQSIKDSAARNKTEFSPFQPRITPDFTNQVGKENHDRNRDAHLREETTTFSPYEDRFRPFRFDNQKQVSAAVLPFHFNEQRKLADSLQKVRDRLAKQISFKEYPRELSPPRELIRPAPIGVAIAPISPMAVAPASPQARLIEQLSASNQYLSEQVAQYKQIVSRLETELRTRDSKVLLVSQNVERRVLEERMSSEKVIAEMRNEIRLLLEKNQILARRLQHRDADERDKNTRHRNCQTVYEASIRPNKRESQGTVKFEQTAGNTQLVEELTNLINKQYFQKIVKDKNPGKIKYASRQLKPVITQILKRNVKLESFANCVIDMRAKISEVKDHDLKKCWKWLKGLVEEAYRVKRMYETEVRQKLGLKQGASSQQVCQAVLRRI